jgi:basic membrane lipoprotein Med (substrate-binding protein (PBP1-ABC) superfamily)
MAIAMTFSGGDFMKTKFRFSVAFLALALFMGLCLAFKPAFAEEPRLTIGAIYVGSVNDYGYNRSFHDALTQVAKNIPGVKLLEAENVPESPEAERIMEGMVQQGARLIFATSFGHQDSSRNVAKRHKDVFFEYAGDGSPMSNFGIFFGATQAAWYPMGVAAGKMTKTHKLGFVIGLPIGYAIGNVNAFELGAKSVNPQAKTVVVVTGGWSDKAKEAGAANALLDQGCDVVGMHVDSPATIIQTVEARGGMSIGFQSVEARALAPKGWITGLGFTWGQFFTDVANSVIAGKFSGQAVYQGLGKMVAIAPFGSAVPVDVQNLVNASAERIVKGFNPFTGPMVDNQGIERIRFGASMGADQMGTFHWYVDGVIGKVH